MMWDSFALRSAIKRGGQAALVIVAHMVMAAVMLLSIWILERIVHLLWRSAEPQLFDSVPLNYLFQAMDVGVLTTFVVYGLIEAYRSYRGRDKRKPNSDR